MRVELVHEWLTNMAGSEKVVGALRRAYPGAAVNTMTAACLAAMEGGAEMVRVHDVAEVAQAIRVASAIGSANGEPGGGPE